MDLEIISMLAFFTLVGVLLWRDRKKIEFNYGIIIRRMYSGRRALDNMIKKHKRFFRIFGNIAVIVSIITACVGTGLLVVFPVVFKTKSFALVLPTVSTYRYPGPIISIPIWYWLIAVFIIMASHETMHAIMSRLAGISIKNYGLIFLLVLPIGAFVDPDMKKIAKLKLMEKLRIYAAGSFGNFITGAVIMVLIFSSMWVEAQVVEDVGIKFENTVAGTPAEAVGLSGIIYEIDGIEIKNQADLQTVLSEIKPGDTINILTTDGEFELTTIESPYASNTSYLGIENSRDVYKYRIGPSAGNYVADSSIGYMIVWYNLLFWIFVLSVGVAIVNLLPMKPLDGGYIFEELAKEQFGRSAEKLTKIASITIAVLLIFNLLFFDLIKFLLSLVS